MPPVACTQSLPVPEIVAHLAHPHSSSVQMALRVLCAALLSAAFADAASLYNSSAMVPYSLWSSAAYCSVQQITSWSCQACKKTTRPVAVTVVQNKSLDAYGFVARLPDDSIAVVFRGCVCVCSVWLASRTARS